VLELAIAWVLSLAFFGESAGTDCAAPPASPSLQLVYRLQESGGVSERARDETVAIVCERLQAIEVPGQVSAVGEREIQVVLPASGGGVSERTIEWIGAKGELLFYDWEPNLIGPERRIGGHPGLQPPSAAVRRAEREWRVAGRNPSRFLNSQLLFAGAFPNLYGAVELASGQRPRERCGACIGPRFYMFDRTPRHRLIAGPATTRAGLRVGAAGESGVVLRVPLGTAIVFEYPFDQTGEVRRTAAPGWYALRDRPALSGADIVDPVQEYGLFDEPSVVFGFTDRGQKVFQRVTRAIARRGQARARGPVSGAEAEALSGHFAIALDGEVRSRPIINFAENPDGIDGRTGAQISGGFTTVEEAQDLAASLRIGALPAEMILIRSDRR